MQWKTLFKVLRLYNVSETHNTLIYMSCQGFEPKLTKNKMLKTWRYTHFQVKIKTKLRPRSIITVVKELTCQYLKLVDGRPF